MAAVPLSVGIPACAVEPDIADTLEGVLTEPLPGGEVIVVHDGSSDGTASVEGIVAGR